MTNVFRKKIASIAAHFGAGRVNNKWSGNARLDAGQQKLRWLFDSIDDPRVPEIESAAGIFYEIQPPA